MKKRLCDIDIWQKDWFLDLPDKKKLLVKFLYDNCNCAGVYEISWKMLRLFFSESICREDFLDLKQIRFIDENIIFIEDFISFQYGISDFNKLNPNNNVHKGILKVLKKYNIFEHLVNSSLTLDQPLGNSCLTVLDMDKDKVKDKEEDNTSNLLKEEEIKKEEEKIKDPYMLYSKVKEAYEKETKKEGYLNDIEVDRLWCLYTVTPDFLETLPRVLKVLHALQDKWKVKLKYEPPLSYILKSENGKSTYSDIRAGTYDAVYQEWWEEEKARIREKVNNEQRDYQTISY